MVGLYMVRLGTTKLKIFNTIVIFNAVQMVDYFRRFQITAHLFFHNNPMFKYIAQSVSVWVIGRLNINITMLVSYSSAIPIPMFFTNTPFGLFFPMLIRKFNSFMGHGHSLSCRWRIKVAKFVLPFHPRCTHFFPCFFGMVFPGCPRNIPFLKPHRLTFFIFLLLPIILLGNLNAAEIIPDFSENSTPLLNEELRDIRGSKATRTINWFISGAVAATTEQQGRFYLPVGGTITYARAHAKTAPAGAALIVDINKNGTSIWNSTTGKRLQLADGASTGTQDFFDTNIAARDDYITLDVDQVGSGTAGSNLTVTLEIEETLTQK